MDSKINCTCGWSWNKSDSSKKDMYICHECGRDNKMKNGGWLDNYNDSKVSLPEGFVGEGYNTKGRDYSPAWGGSFHNGGEIPQAQQGTIIQKDLNNSQVKQVNDLTGMNFEPEFAQKYFMTEEESKLKDIQRQQQMSNAALQHTNKIIDITSESSGPFSNKRIWHDKRPEYYTSSGQEVRDGYEYTTVLAKDWKNYQKSPQYLKYKNIPPTNTVASMQQGGIIKDDNGYWNPKNWGKKVEIDQSDPDSFIDMENVYEPLIGVSKETGEKRIMYPGEKHKFGKETKKVIESPLAKNGKELDQLTNFTNYNKTESGSWLDTL